MVSNINFVYLNNNIVEVENGVTSFLLLPYITKEQNRVFSNTFAKRQIYQSRSSSWAVVIYFVVLPAQIQKGYRVVALQYISVQASIYSIIEFHNMLRI